MPEPQQTVVDLGRAVKSKYAGAYDDLDDAEFGRRVQAKFPGAYDDYTPVSPVSTVSPVSPAQAPMQPYAAQPPAAPPPGQLMHPQQVDAMATENAQHIVAALNAPRPAAPTLAPGPTTTAPPSIGQQLWQSAQTPIPQTAHEMLGTGVQAPTVRESGAALGEAARQGIDKFMGAGSAAKIGRDFPALGLAGNILDQGAQAAGGLVDFGMSPVGLITAGVAGVSAIAGKLMAAGFGTSMAPGAWQAIKTAYKDPSSENIAKAIVDTSMALLPVAHPAAGLAKDAVKAKPKPAEGTATITGREPYQPTAEPAAQAPTQTPTQPLAAQPAKPTLYPNVSNDNLTRLLKIETNPEKRAKYAAAATERGMTVPEATPVTPRIPITALHERPTRYEEHLQYRQLFDEAAARQKKLTARQARTKPAVPETGAPDERTQAAREDVARWITGKSYAAIEPEGQQVIDQWVREGYIGAAANAPAAAPTSVTSVTAKAPSKPSKPAEEPTSVTSVTASEPAAARAKKIQALRAGGLTYKAAVAQVDAAPPAKPVETPAAKAAPAKTAPVAAVAPVAQLQGVAEQPQLAAEPKAETLEYRGTGPAKRDHIKVYVRQHAEGWDVHGEGELGGHSGGHLGSSGYDKFHQTRQAAIDAFVKSATRPQGTLTAEMGSGYESFAPRQKKMLDWVQALASKPEAPPPAPEPPAAPEPPNEFAAKRAEAQKKKYQAKNAARLEAEQQAFRDANEAARARNEESQKAAAAPAKLAVVKPLTPAQKPDSTIQKYMARRIGRIKELRDGGMTYKEAAAQADKEIPEPAPEKAAQASEAASRANTAERHAREELDELQSKYQGPGPHVDAAPKPGTDQFNRDHERIAELREQLGKQIWQRRQADAQRVENVPPARHREAVQRAIAEGKTIPPEVLADYPGIAEAPWTPPAEKPAPKAKAAAPKAKETLKVPPGTPSAKMFDELSAELAAIEKNSLYTKDTPGGSSLRDRAIDLRETIEFHRPAAVARAQKAIDAEKGKRKRTIEEPHGRQQSTAGSGGTGEGGALHEPLAPGPRRTPQAEARRGEATEVIVPDEKRSIPAHYEVRELDEIHPSHNGVTFSANPQYELENERDYSKPENQQRVIKQSSEDLFEPRYHITDNADMGNGPPLVTERGSAIGGNSRAMQLQRVYGRNGEKAAAYRAFLEKKAAQFGIDPQVVRGMRQPVLVRVATPEGLEALPGGVKWAVRKTNVTGTAALSSSERAAADAGQMSPEMITHIAGAIEAAGADATLNDALTGNSGTRIVNSLIADGFFSEQERPSLMDGKTGVLTQSAKDRIAKALLGKFFRNSDQIARTPAAIKSKLERAAAPLAKVAGDAEWDITPDVREAIDLIEYAAAHGIKNLGDALNQTSMFGDAPTSPEGVVRIADLLRDGKPNDVVSAFRKYVNSKEPTMFGESTPAEAFEEAFGAEKPAKRSPEHGGATLNQMTLGLASFIEQDVAPSLRRVAGGMRDTAEDIVRVLAPSVLSRPAELGSLSIREKAAELARKTDQAAAALRDASKYFEKQDPEENFEFMDRVENGKPQKTAELDAIAGTLRQMLNQRRSDVQKLGTGKLQSFYKNYFPHIWEKPERAKSVFAAFFGKRPLEGSKAFLKKRTYPTIADGRAAGLVPLTDNPVEMTLLKVREMDRYVMAHETLNDWKKTRLARFIDARTGKAPAGWAKIDDPIGTVYGQSIQQISEYPNEGIYRGLEAVADALGLKHTRGFKNLRGAIGRAHIAGGLIETAHGSKEGTFAHEIGHQIDWLAGSGKRFVTDYPDAQTVQRLKAAYKTLKDTNASPADRTAARKELKSLKGAIADRREFAKQLRDLADLRDGPQSYVRSREEKMAQLAQMWVEGRDLFKRTAPKVFAKWKEFLNENPKLHALRDIEAGANATVLSQPYDVGGLVIKGHYWAPEGAARILNNYLSPGLGRYASYRAVMGVNNVLNQFQLGLSAFHLGFVTADTTVSKAALGFQALLRGKPIQAAKFFAQTPTAAFTTFMEGNRMLKEWYEPGSQGALVGKMLDAAVKGGMRARMDSIYQTHAHENMMKALRHGNVLGAAIRAPLAGVEFLSNLIMGEVVPRMKMGAFADLARFQMENMGPNATTEDVHRVLAQAADSIDNRLGEMVYDNLFWNKIAKDIAMISVRSVGWNLGTLREIGGGIIDIGAQPANKLRGKPVNLNRLSYLMGLVTVSAVTNAIYQYLHTGKGPQELKDYFFPKNGETDENGRAQRISTPTYIKDVYHYGTHPLKTLQDKVAPIWSLAAEMIHNRDFYGVEIRNADDPLLRQLAEIAQHVAGSTTPIGVRNYQRETGLGASPLTRAEQFFGISPAPTDLDASGAERLAREYAAARVPDEPRTTASAARRELRQSMTRALAQHKPVPAAVLDALRAGQFTKRDMQEAKRESRESSLTRSFTRLPIREALRVYAAATAKEKSELRGPLVKKARAARENLAGAERQAMMDAVRGALAAP